MDYGGMDDPDYSNDLMRAMMSPPAPLRVASDKQTVITAGTGTVEVDTLFLVWPR